MAACPHHKPVKPPPTDFDLQTIAFCLFLAFFCWQYLFESWYLRPADRGCSFGFPCCWRTGFFGSRWLQLHSKHPHGSSPERCAGISGLFPWHLHHWAHVCWLLCLVVLFCCLDCVGALGSDVTFDSRLGLSFGLSFLSKFLHSVMMGGHVQRSLDWTPLYGLCVACSRMCWTRVLNTPLAWGSPWTVASWY